MRKLTLIVIVLGAALSANAWEIKLNVKEEWGQPGKRHVTGGVPLLPGQAGETAELCLARKNRDGDFAAVPAQFRVLARYWRGDNSIRWVLADFITPIGNTENKVFYLTNRKPDAVSEATVRVRQTEDTVEIDTGPAQFTINRKKFAFLDRAVVQGVEILQASPELGSVVEDTYGNKYYSSAGTKQVDVLDEGPIRVSVRARGRHVNPDGKGYAPGMYMFDVIMHFYAGSSVVSVDYVVCNNPPKSTGAPTFEDASLLMRFKDGAGGYTVYGSAPLDGGLGGKGSMCLYQDSNGAETWQRCQGYSGAGPGGANFPTGKTVRFKGYKILRRIGNEEQVLAGGDRARGILAAGNAKGGIVMHTREFWQQFPKAVEVSADGTIRFGAFPREAKLPHFIEDGSGKGHELYLLFYVKDKSTGYATNGDNGRPWGHVFSDTWDYPVFPRPDLEHIAATGALTDVGPSSIPKYNFADYEMEIRNRRKFMTDPYWGNGYGWQTYGSTWQAFGGHSQKGARQPIKEDFYLYRWYWTGHPNWYVAGQRRSRNFRDVRNYRIEDVNPFGFGNWANFRKSFNSEQYCARPQLKGEPYETFRQGAWWRNPWELPNPSHMTLDLCYDRYLLFGDPRAFENLRIIAGHGGNYAAYTPPKVHRLTGWSWRALVRYWELTGDKEAELCLMDTIANYAKLLGKGQWSCGGHGGGWFTQIHSRAVAMTALHTRDKTALEICKEFAVGKEAQAKDLCTLFAVCYHLSGDEKYKTAVLGKGTGDSLLTVCTLGDFPATAHWLLQQKPNPVE